MSVGLKTPSDIASIEGVRLSSICASIYNNNRTDLTLIELSEGSSVSAVFTKNNFCAAPVKLAKQHLNKITPRYLLINAGNANAGTGEEGLVNASKTCKTVAESTGCLEYEVLPFSTGVIGEELPYNKINDAIPKLVNNLSKNSWLAAAEAIMTTDTIPKAVSKKISVDGTEISITGITKGAGMIRPDMATMLAFIATDASITKKALDSILVSAVNKSFNRITIDGDTSTNDACVLLATGKAKAKFINDIESQSYVLVKAGIIDVLSELAQMIVRDGEGASKFLTIEVNGGREEGECLAIAYKIAESPLVKTAFTASDPNWGRIIAAIGNVDINDLDITKVNIFIDTLCIVENGKRASSYSEEAGKEVMIQDDIKLTVQLNRGDYEETVWTTDLSHEYITINAEYRT